MNCCFNISDTKGIVIQCHQFYSKFINCDGILPSWMVGILFLSNSFTFSPSLDPASGALKGQPEQTCNFIPPLPTDVAQQMHIAQSLLLLLLPSPVCRPNSLRAPTSLTQLGIYYCDLPLQFSLPSLNLDSHSQCLLLRKTPCI